jgi:hypothetical protein
MASQVELALEEPPVKTRSAIVSKLVVALALLLGAGVAQAQTVLFDDPSEPTKATGILNLDVPGFPTPFDVEFDQQAFANQIYGPFPGDLSRLPPFATLAETEVAADAVNAVLTTQGANAIGEVGLQGTDVFNIGWIAFVLDVGDVESIGVVRSLNETGEWINTGENFLTWNLDERDWAVFTAVPEPGSALSMVSALATLGVVARWRRG